jgi:hypothetical protein
MRKYPLISPIQAPFSHFGRLFDTNSAKNELLLGKSPYSLSIWLQGAILELKMTANSTYWEAKLRSNGLKQVKIENGKSSIMIILTFVF